MTKKFASMPAVYDICFSFKVMAVFKEL